MRWTEWLDEDGPWKVIPKEYTDYTPEMQEAMWDGMKYLVVVAVVGTGIVIIQPYAVTMVAFLWMVASFLLISRPAIYDRMEKKKDLEN